MPRCPTCGESNAEHARFCSSCGTRLEQRSAAPVEARRTVTVVFADVVGSTSLVDILEPESARQVLDRFYEAVSRVVESHGGTVEKFIGDAVMAVFGIPVLHEDDALRAVRAASEMHQALGVLNSELQDTLGVTIQMRIGVNTGEVVVRDPASGQAFVTGDAVNVAARLEATAAPGEVRVGEATFQLVRNTASAEPLGLVRLKGTLDAAPAYRLLSIGTSHRTRRFESRFVGRERELKSLIESFEEASRGRSSRLVTVIGAAGVGKSRLIEEFLGMCSAGVTIVRGRCLPYGDGITFWPLKEAIEAAAGLRGDESAVAARARIRALVEPATDADLIVERIGETIGLTEAVSEHKGGAWATRRLFEEIARERPLVVVFDDIQWAEIGFLELVEYLVSNADRSPILVVCVARPELLEARLSWAIPSERARQVVLQPLSDDDVAKLLRNLLGDGELDPAVRTKIVEVSEGLPLFIEELIATLVEDGSLSRAGDRWVATDLSQVAVPPTVQALLAARLDRLSSWDQALLERGAVEGQVFHRGAVAYLSPETERPDIDAELTDLVLSGVIEPASATFADETAFRFHHLLLRDVAYASLPKDDRSSLHGRFAEWLEAKAGERASEYDEILGYHLEQAFRYETELRPHAAVDDRLAQRAGERLGSAGVRAHARGDWPAAAGLLSRAIELMPRENDARARLEPTLADALLEIAPATGGFISALRCYVRWPIGHAWTVRVRLGEVLLRCTRCGREKPLVVHARRRSTRKP